MGTERKNLYTSGEAAWLLGINKYFLQLYREQGIIKGKRIGGWYYYSSNAIRAAKPKIAALAQLKGEKEQQRAEKECARSAKKRQANTPLQKGMSLCWNCTRVYSGCSWSRTQTPVKGWEALLLDTEEYPASRGVYRVQKCPLFDWDEHAFGKDGRLYRKKKTPAEWKCGGK